MGWRPARWCLLGALGCGIAGPASAQALPSGAPDAPAVEARVIELRREAKELFDKRDPEAIERLKTARALSKSPRDICNLGTTQVRFGQLREGAANLSKCQRMAPLQNDPSMAEYWKEFQTYVTYVRDHLGVLEIETNAPGAEILVDGEVAGTIPSEDPIFVDPGRRNVEVRAPGFKSDSRKVEAYAGTSARLKIQLEPLRAEVVPASREESSLKPQAVIQPLVSAPHNARQFEANEPPESSALLKAGITFAGLGAAVSLGSFVAAAIVNGEADAASEQVFHRSALDRPCSAPHHHTVCNKVWSYRHTADVLAGVGIGGLGIAAGGGALVLYDWLEPGSNKGKKASASAVIGGGPAGGALWIQGRF
jgi:hypothetical protein